MPPGAQASLGPRLDPDGCLARSAMRTQPSTEETGAIRTQQLEATDERRWQLALPKNFARHLDDRPANGCHCIVAKRYGAWDLIRGRILNFEKVGIATIISSMTLIAYVVFFY